MLFGEIVEPSTRALIDDDFEEYPEYTSPKIIWKGNNKVPSDLNTLVFIEGTKTTKLFNALILNDDQDVQCKLESGDVQIYKTTNVYIISYTEKNLTTGEIVEELSEWILKAKDIYTIISVPLSAYQTLNPSEKAETLIRKLSTKNDGFSYQKLESPNLVSGLGADVLSYCIHTGLNATLFVVYMDNSPLDSINVSPVIHLMKSLNLDVKQTVSDLNPVPSNLYL